MRRLPTGEAGPYVYGPAHLLDFVRQTFAAEVVERSSDGGQVEVRIGDSVVSMALGEDFPQETFTRSSIYVYIATFVGRA